MKRVILPTIAALSVMAFAGNSMAQNNMNGGFSGPAAVTEVVTVTQASAMSDDSYVTLQGNITNNLGDEKYTFTDASGSITVEIDDEDWKGLNVGPKDMVQIKGEVDTNWTKPTKIDVDTINIISK